MRRPSGTIDGLARLTADGWRLVEEWIEPDLWSWVYRQPRRRSLYLVLTLAILTGSCAPPVVPPIVVPPPVLVVVLPGPLRHDLTSWLDEDIVCVHAPATQALYLHQRCLTMATVRSLILTLRDAE